MKVLVLFFGLTADVAGCRETIIELEEGTIASCALAVIVNNFPQLAEYKLLFAVNHEYVLGPEALNDGDELAVFTAVSGG